MTDKQIIIDGCDVSGCNFILERDGKIKCECTHATGFGVICDCESWKTCDYKNYKRKEHECEELKEEKQKLIKENLEQKCKIRKLFDENATKEVTFKVNGKTATAKKNKVKQILDLIENPDQLKTENEELKEFQKLLEEQMKFNKSELELSLSSEIKRSEFLLKEFKKADKQRDNWREKAEKLKQTLAEIKPILELYANSKIGEEQPDGTYKYSGQYSGQYSGKYTGEYFESNNSVYINYDPRPAREGLKKISEVEDEQKQLSNLP